MDAPSSYDDFDIISTIRSDAILLYSEANTTVNCIVKSTISRTPLQFYMLSYHQERMLASAKAFGWDTSQLEGPQAFERLTVMLHDHLQSKYDNRTYPAPLMLRIAFSANGTFTITSDGPHPLPATIYQARAYTVSQLYPKSLFDIVTPMYGAPYLRWAVFVTIDKVAPSLFTRHKTSSRRQYDEALALLPAHPLDLILNGVQLQPEVLIVNDEWQIMEGCRFTPYFWREKKWITPAAECGGNLGTTRRWALERRLCEEGVVQGGSVKYNEIIVLSNGARGFQAGIVKPWT